MEFEKGTGSEASQSHENETQKKEKKKRRSKKTIAAPVPAEIIAEETKKAEKTPELESEDATEKISKKRKKKKRAPRPETEQVLVETGQQSPSETVNTQEPQELEIPDPEVTEAEDAESREHNTGIGLETADEEMIILPHAEEDTEGELFVSDRLRHARQAPEFESDVDEDPTILATQRGRKKTKARSQTSKTAATSAPATQPQTTTGATGRRKGATATLTAAAATTGGAAGAGGGGYNAPPRTPNNHNAAPVMPQRTPEAVPPRRNHERRNLVAGLLIGGIIEHIRHKRREKRMEKAHKKEVRNIQNEHEAEKLRTEQRTNREKTSLEKTIERLQQRVVKNEHIQTERQKRPMAEKSTQTIPQKPETAKKAEIQPALAAKPEVTEGGVEIPSDRRVETSAWHRIEVDKKTGKAVEDPSVAYGKEFQNEQHQEKLRKTIADASIESEKVKQAYLSGMPQPSNPITSQQNPSVEPLSSPARSSHKTKTPPSSQYASSNILERAKQSTSQKEPIDIILWAVLFVVLGIIVVLL